MPILAFKMPARVASRSRASTKGRGGRKGGRDRRSSGPERSRVLKPQNYSTTPAIKAWRPPVPEPLPPAPLLGPKQLLGLGALVLMQVWGWLNGRPKRSQYAPPLTGALETTGTVPPPGNTIGATLVIKRPVTYGVIVSEPGCEYESTSTQNAAQYNRTNVVGVAGPMGEARGCGFRAVYYLVTYTNGTTTKEGFGLGTANSYISWTAGYDFTWNHPTAVPFENPVEDLPEPSGFSVPQVEPSSVPDAPAPLPLPLPGPATVPQVEPEVQPAVAPVAPDTSSIPLPQVVRTTTVVQQQQLPGAITVQNGALPAPTPTPVPTTDPGSIIPWPGAAPIPGSGPTPAPTLDGIAKEVGRIERKLEVMNTPNAPGNLVDQIGNLQDLIGPIVELILAATSGTVYTLDSPCEVDGDGNRLPAVEVEAPGGLTQFGAILNRIDALAELLQVHKDLKQPNCRGADVPVGGEFVTVNFEQID
jgi:hypothetical protein